MPWILKTKTPTDQINCFDTQLHLKFPNSFKWQSRSSRERESNRNGVREKGDRAGMDMDGRTPSRSLVPGRASGLAHVHKPGDQGFCGWKPLGASCTHPPTWTVVSQWVWCNIWVMWSEAVLTLVDIHFPVPNLKAGWRPWPRGCRGAGRHPLSLQHPPSQIPTIHSSQPPACPLFLANSLWTAFPLLPVSITQKCGGLRRP